MKLKPMERTSISAMISLLKDCRSEENPERRATILNFSIKELTDIFNEEDVYRVNRALNTGRPKRMMP